MQCITGITLISYSGITVIPWCGLALLSRNEAENGYTFAPGMAQAGAWYAIASQSHFASGILFPYHRYWSSRPPPSPLQRYNTLDFAGKVVCQGDAVPVGFPATKPQVSLDSSSQRELCPLWNPLKKAKAECDYWQAHSVLLSRNVTWKFKMFLSHFYWLPWFPWYWNCHHGKHCQSWYRGYQYNDLWWLSGITEYEWLMIFEFQGCNSICSGL